MPKFASYSTIDPGKVLVAWHACKFLTRAAPLTRSPRFVTDEFERPVS